MKNIITWVIAIVIVLGGAWLLWPKSSSTPEATPTPLAVTPSTSPSVSPTPTESVQPKKTPTPTPTPTLPLGTAVTPTITSVTAYQTQTEPSGWWVSIKGSFSGVCARPLSPSFSRDGNTFLIVLPAQSVANDACMATFDQTLLLAHDPLAPGIYTVSVNGQSWTSFIVSEPIPEPAQ